MKSFKHFLNESIVDQFLAVKEQALKAKAVVDQHNAKPSIVSRFLTPVIRVGMPGQGLNADRKISNPSIKHTITRDKAFVGRYSPPRRTSSSYVRKADTNRTPMSDYGMKSTLGHELAHSYQHEAQLKNTKIKPRISWPGKIGLASLGAAAAAQFVPMHSTGMAIGKGIIMGGILGAGIIPPRTVDMKSSKPKYKKMSGSTKLSRSDKRKQKYNDRLTASKFRPDNATHGLNASGAEYYDEDIEANARVIGHAVANLHDYHHQMARHIALNWNHEPGKMISDFRNTHMKAFEDSEKDLPVSKSVRAHMKKQFGRILQYHEDQLPKDLHTDSVAVEYFNKHHGDVAAIGKGRQAHHDAIYKQ